MFKRLWDNLPKDPAFEPDLAKLGYFINDIDEVRNIAEPQFYYKFFLTKNNRWNERQRFAFHEVLEKEIHSRLEATGLAKLRLPIGAGPEGAHVPIFASQDLSCRSRVVIVVGESIQDLGVLAYRMVSGPGGVGAGSLVNFAKALASPEGGAAPPGLVLANTGQLWWWPQGRRALNEWSRDAVPMPSAVHYGHPTREENRVPGNHTPAQHVRYLFNEFLPTALGEGAVVDVIGICDGADAVHKFLDQEDNWEKWGPRLGSFVSLGGFFDGTQGRVAGLKEFLRDRGRAYILSDEPLDIPISGAEGNPKVGAFTSFGCPVYSSGETGIGELIMIKAMDSVLAWLREVAQDPDYTNPQVTVTYNNLGEETGGWGGENFVEWREPKGIDKADENVEEINVTDKAPMQAEEAIQPVEEKIAQGAEDKNKVERVQEEVKQIEGGEDSK
ncbi:hypothetical protein GGTG_11724 [Gaeumannomyces tritici R3-111a-1]|uniref:Arb2 domain-containing protein n=1 Tax=Gaeumannomyces tritici (strain R3-111a-1) TaxID=644352 RepID=J3PE01_GAET3|nr:hypothetical protein GGTG_11724 [Gaeumannomyces tritici R3-111a-1]EJT70701.1 hypothetical protein GGTG_11724 [Gaeumannomyces tritici R3-111a-1]